MDFRLKVLNCKIASVDGGEFYSTAGGDDALRLR